MVSWWNWRLRLYKPLPLFIGLRYFSSGGGGNRLVSFISLLAISGLVLGVCLLIVVQSVMNGFDRELRERILSVVPMCKLFINRGSPTGALMLGLSLASHRSLR